MMMSGVQRNVTVSWTQMVTAGAAAAIAWLILAGLVSAVSGTGFWSPWILMAATISRNVDGLTTDAPFDIAGVILGFVVQLILSVVLAVVFGLIAARFVKTPAGLVTTGIVYGLAVFLVMWYVARPAVTPGTFDLGPAAYLAGYVAWGAVLGLFVGRGVTFR